jgi:hypothetical protein
MVEAGFHHLWWEMVSTMVEACFHHLWWKMVSTMVKSRFHHMGDGLHHVGTPCYRLPHPLKSNSIISPIGSASGIAIGSAKFGNYNNYKIE